MTINTTARTSQTYNSGSTFAFSFKVFVESDVVVKTRSTITSTETTLSYLTHYFVTLNTDQNSNPGGSITLQNVLTPQIQNGTLASLHELIITSNISPLQGTDLTNQGGFFPEVINDALDKSIILHQQIKEKLDRSIGFSLTNTIGSLEITESASARANKVLAFDSAGEFQVLQELGQFKGNWAAGTSYVQRDIVKDTQTNNIFICTGSHTSSGAEPLTTNTDSGSWSLLVDAAAATTAQTAAAASAAAAATSESNASTSATNAQTHATNANTAKVNSQVAAIDSENAKNAAEAALDTFDDRFLGAKASDPTLDNDGDALLDGALYWNTTDNVTKIYDAGNTAWVSLKLTVTEQNNVNTVGSNIANVNSVANISAEISAVSADATNIATVGQSISNVNNVANNITNVNTVASNVAGVNSFAERYRTDNSGSNPATNNDAGDLFFNQNTGKLLVYNGNTSAWEEASPTIGSFDINTISQFTGTGGNSATFNGVAYKFTINNAPVSVFQLLVSINGVLQKPNSGTSQPAEGFALDGANIVFSSAPATGSDYFIITLGQSVNVNVPSANTVSTSVLQDESVTLAKLAHGDASSDGKFLRANNGADPTFETVTDSTKLPTAGGTLTGNVSVADDVKIQFGAGNDLQIYHNNTDNWSYIEETDVAVEGLRIRGQNLVLEDNAGDNYVLCKHDAEVILYYDNSAKIETTSTGVGITGKIDISGAIDENVFAITDAATVDLEPDNGMIQTWTLGANRTATDNLSNGQSMLLIVTATGSNYTVTWPTMTFVGGTAPTLGGATPTAIELFKVGGTLYGATVGNLG